jgi:hypothetical protein
VSPIDQSISQIAVIFNDAVVYNDQFAGTVSMRVGVFLAGFAVGGPSGVSDANRSTEGIFGKGLVQFAYLSHTSA